MKKIAFLFPGQGSQYAGMGKSLYDNFEVARQVYREADEVLGFSLSSLCFSGNLIDLNKHNNMLPAILTASVAAYRVFQGEYGIVPAYCAGHSLGEYSALACSGALDFADALRIVLARCAIADQTVPPGTGAMTIVNGLTIGTLQRECLAQSAESQVASIACYNSDKQIVIAGHSETVLRVEDNVMELDGQITPLLTSPPFHSPLMEEAAQQLKEELSKYTFKRAEFPVISNATALPCTEPGILKENLIRQMTGTVLWKPTLDYIQQNAIDIVLEIGPQSVLTNLILDENRPLQALSYNQKEDRERFSEAVGRRRDAGLSAERQTFRPTVVTGCLVEAVSCRNRNWNNTEYEKGVIEPFENIQKLQERLESEEASPTLEQMKEALSWLLSVFEVKGVPQEEQSQRIERIITEAGMKSMERDLICPDVYVLAKRGC